MKQTGQEQVMACESKACSLSMRSVTWAMVLGGSLALLIWAKLRLVTTVPRTAYAEPEQVDHSPKPEAATGTTGAGSGEVKGE
jgi:hypothetical protein